MNKCMMLNTSDNLVLNKDNIVFQEEYIYIIF